MNGAAASPWIAFYGDDFTGSTDALDGLARSGVDTVLFLRRPDSGTLDRFRHCRAIGLAGDSRSRSPEWMDAHLPGEFRWLRSTGADLFHYKVCSTFDSSPAIGSIGRAIDLGHEVFQPAYVPVVVGMPALKRYTVFGHLFAGVGGETYRIDRHPTMSRHPVTPMDEADLRVHLGRQTSKRIALFDFLSLQAADSDTRWQSLIEEQAPVILLDVLDQASLARAGRLLWEHRRQGAFLAGSSGVEYALVEHWKSTGLLDDWAPPSSVAPADRIAVLSGSCSPVTEQQILNARRHGFHTIGMDTAALAGGAGADTAIALAREQACAALRCGSSIVLYSACGAADRISISPGDREQLAARSGRLFHEVLQQSGVRRAVIAGGDTSSHAGQELGLSALTFLVSLAPGAPLCRGHSDQTGRDGLEIVFKGGQIGGEDFFEQVREGRAINSGRI